MKLPKLFLGALVAATVLCVDAVPAAETLTVTRNDRGKTVALRPVVHWPSGSGPFGVVIVVNSSSGSNDLFLSASVAPMNGAGIAVAALDTFTPRGISDTATNQSKVSSSQMALDALQVAQALRRDSRVKSDKVAVLGQSKGGVTALHAATRAWYRFVRTSQRPFDASVAIAPGCELQFREPELASPLFGIFAEKDDNTLASTCVSLLKRMRAAGQPAKWEVVPDAYHSWSTTGTYYKSDLFSIRNCADEPYYYTRSGFQSSKDGKVIPFRSIFKRCGARGYTIGGPRDKVGYVLEQARDWLKSQGW